MKLLIRADASSSIGVGHVARCLTIADALAVSGCESLFLCRELPGDAREKIRRRGYKVLPVRTSLTASDGFDVKQDAAATRAYIESLQPDWLIVDHYRIDRDWERLVAKPGMSMFAIDDLANRAHSVDALLDQNLGRSPGDYDGLVDRACLKLVGPDYALLRPQFSRLRRDAKAARRNARLEHLLISFGGSDPNNVTGSVLQCLARSSEITTRLRCLTVILGNRSILLDDLERIAGEIPITTEFIVDTEDIAFHMLRADLALGAGGSTSWERCCLGLPSVVLSLAENQVQIARHLAEAGASIDIGSVESDWQTSLVRVLKRLQADTSLLGKMSKRAFGVTDGLGVARVCHQVFGTVLPSAGFD